jgi:arylsulfatase A-like enzyme
LAVIGVCATVAVATTVGITSCTGSSGPAPVPAAEATTLVLSEVPFAELKVPNESRAGVEPPEKIPVEGPWHYSGTTRKEMHKYVAPVPIRPRGLFFHKAEPGMSLETSDGANVKYDRFGKTDGYMWSHDRKDIIVYFPEKNGPPTDGQFVMTYGLATEREKALNFKWSGKTDPKAFVWTTIQDDWDSRRGLLLPAPGVASWDVTIPTAGELQFTSGLVEPEIRSGNGSDGAKLVVEVEIPGSPPEQVFSTDLAIRSFEPQRVDLERWAGKAVRLRVKTEPGATPDFDYAFLAEPVVASRKQDPTKVVLVFVDTLRPDHMSLYGYNRDTTAAIDHLGQSAVVFDHARSVAPWTLPSARSIVTGRHPEYYDASETLQEVLRKRGFATAFIAGNVYLSSNFGMHRDWEFHRVGLWPEAEEITDDALAWIDAHEGRDVILQVHYMNTHLPYIEPASYRRKYAGDGIDGLRDEFHLSDVRKAKINDDTDAQQYVRDRYDNNVRYTTDQVQRILERIDANDILVFYSDHGEEFWEHNGFEHGHTLYDELLHVPLIVQAPGLTPKRVADPVSLLDIAPTILDLLGVAPDTNQHFDGTSLLPLIRGEPTAVSAMADRPLAFGRPLYGSERWGVLSHDKKWTTHDGREQLYDLVADPGEQQNLMRKQEPEMGAPYRNAMGAALGRDVAVGYRLVPSPHRGGNPVPGLWAMCTVPGGFGEAWSGDDPLENSAATVRPIEDRAKVLELLAAYHVSGHEVPENMGRAVEICWHSGLAGSREVYLMPAQPLADVGAALVCSGYLGDADSGSVQILRPDPSRPAALDKNRLPLDKKTWPQRSLSLNYGIAPVPSDQTQSLRGRDGEINEMLERMGYVDPEQPEDDGDGNGEGIPAHAGGCEPPRPPS